MQIQGEKSGLEKNKAIFIFLGAFVVLAVVIVMIFFVMRMIGAPKQNGGEKNPDQTPAASSTPQATSTGSAVLPVIPETASGTLANGNGQDWAAEKVSFGDYYKAPKALEDLAPPELPLPLNVKIEAANYYDVYRKINLDAGLDSLNSNGFAVLDNPFASEADNFYKMFSLLNSKEVPVLVTGDFLVYYYQNVLKLAYQDLENSVFYDNLWATSKSLYQTARDRYERKVREQGEVNDVSLEGSRLETAYLAVALSLLAPAADQITKEGGLSKGAGFTKAEAEKFSFQLPDYLKEDVSREVKLIQSGTKKTIKSPVLLYERDYNVFSIPDAYRKNARLNNFYLTSRWLNSVFPLNYKDESCRDCLLDKDDWRINLAAAFLLSGDFAADQELQNRWAKIYKIQSFFSGLRGDLSYLYYNQAFKDVFGGEKNINDVLEKKETVNQDLDKLQAKLSEADFPATGGGLSRAATATKPLLGLKILVDAYRPDNYLFGRLTYPEVGVFAGNEAEARKMNTSCNIRGKEKALRCFGSAFDLVNLIHPLREAGSDYFSSNANYENYYSKADELRAELGKRTIPIRHNTNYWTALELGEKFLIIPDKEKAAWMESPAWQRRSMGAAAAIWANGNLPADVFAPSDESSAVRLDQLGRENPYTNFGYIEPNLALSQELTADVKMVSQMLALLKVDESGNNVLSDLRSLQKNLEGAEAIVVKELKGEDLNEEDTVFVSNLIKEFSVKETGGKTFEVSSSYGKGITENLSGVKLLTLLYWRGGKLYISVGPVFNLREEKKR